MIQTKLDPQWVINWFLNPFTDKQLNFLGTVPKQVCHYNLLSILCLGFKTISQRAVILHPKLNIESHLKRDSVYILWHIKMRFVSWRVNVIIYQRLYFTNGIYKHLFCVKMRFSQRIPVNSCSAHCSSLTVASQGGATAASLTHGAVGYMGPLMPPLSSPPHCASTASPTPARV